MPMGENPVSQYADAGCYIIYHPEFEGVTVHQREDINITYNKPPIESGWRDKDGSKLWRMLIRPKHKSSLVDRLLMSKSPRVTRLELPQDATEYVHNVCYIIYHPEFEGVTVHRREDINITYNKPPIESGWRDKDGSKLWRMLIRPKHKSSLVDRLLMSKSPRVTRLELPQDATECVHNVYDLLSIWQAIRFMHAACGFPV